MTLKKMSKQELEQQLEERTHDLQRLRADFENYRKRVEHEKTVAREASHTAAVLKLLPVVDDIERAINHIPHNLKDNPWAQGVRNVIKQVNKSLEGLNLKRINAVPGTHFNPELHEAIQFDDDVNGDTEVVAEELRAGYTVDGKPIRPALVRVTRQ